MARINYDIRVDTFVTVEADEVLEGEALEPVFQQAWGKFLSQIRSGAINENSLNCFQTCNYLTGEIRSYVGNYET